MIVKLLEGDRDMIGLLADNPFPDRPPRWIRARMYRFTFTTRAERKATGRWWNRELVGEFFPPVHLQQPGG